MSGKIVNMREKLDGYLPLRLQKKKKWLKVRVSPHGQGAGGPGKVLRAPGVSAAGKKAKVKASAAGKKAKVKALTLASRRITGFRFADGTVHPEEAVAAAVRLLLLSSGAVPTEEAVAAAVRSMLLSSGAADNTTGSK